ncbi:MAG: magnesium chelatase subunit H, partial [Chloroflexaceae bacterium]|nr:magnesium chelatase subunit H [Chloroflexaceae bacterium]
MRFIFLTMDGTQNGALQTAAEQLRRQHGMALELGLYHAPSLRSEADWQRLEADAARADFIFGARLFSEDLVRPLERILLAAPCPVCVVTSNPALIRCTRLGKFVLHKDEGAEPGFWQNLIRKFRPKSDGMSEARRQMALLKNVGKVLKFLPGKAHDLHTFIVAHQYWLDSSPENMGRLLTLLINRYVPKYAGKLPERDPVSYPDMALFHPASAQPFAELADYEKWQGARTRNQEPRTRSRALGTSQTNLGSVGILALRTSALSGNTAHLNALVEALEQRGLAVRMAYGSGLDMRPAIQKFFTAEAQSTQRKDKKAPAPSASPRCSSVDLLVNATGFSLVGGPAESRPQEASTALESLDVPYLDLIPLSFQRVDDWRGDDSGLTPVQLALNVAIPELDGATEPLVYGGPTLGDTFAPLPDMVELAANRIARRVGLRRKSNGEKRVAIAMFSFPPNLGNIGTAAYLDVFASIHRLLTELKAAGYTLNVPTDVAALREAVVGGNASLHGTDGNVAARLGLDDYRRLFPHYADIEPFWGKAPGDMLTNGKEFYILGAQFGNVFVGIQPGFGYERDPMRLLMAKDAAPHHGFAAFYTWLDKVYAADAVIHFGTHGALEFMPGKQVGLSSTCWPLRLIGGLPNLYFYSVNNPSEATIAKRRGLATTISYLVPPLHQAGLYKGLRQLKDSLDAYRQRPAPELLADIQMQAERLQIVDCRLQIDEANNQSSIDSYIATLSHELLQIEQRMIPLGLHVLGQPPAPAELVDFLTLAATFHRPETGDRKPETGKHAGRSTQGATLPALIAAGLGHDYEQLRRELRHSREAQAAWELVEQKAKELVSLFVQLTMQHETLSKQERDRVQQQFSTLNAQFSIPTPLWDFLGDLAYRITHDG